MFLTLSGALGAIRNRIPERRLFALGCLGGIAAIALHSGVSDFNLYMPANAFVAVWLAAILSGLSDKPAQHHASRPSAFLSRRILLAIACVVLLFSLPALVFSESYRGDAAAEKEFCKFGICDTTTVLAASPSAKGPSRELALREAIRREPASPGHWADLGEALLKSGHASEAAPLFANALTLGPNVPPVLLQVADFYQKTGDTDRALPLVARALSQTAVYQTAAFDWLSTYHVPVSRTLAHALPHSRDVYRAYLHYLINSNDAAAAAEIWDVATTRGYIGDAQATEYVNWLDRRKQYQAAAREWAGYLGERAQGYLESNFVYNGDFEDPFLPLALDWSAGGTPGVDVTRDPETKYSGKFALRVHFDGTQNVSSTGVSERVFVEPGSYRFEAFVKALGLTTDQGVSVRIMDAEDPRRLNFQTPPLQSTEGWEKLSRDLCIAPRTQILDISLVRQPSFKFDDKFWGLYWLDAVSLSRTGSSCR